MTEYPLIACGSLTFKGERYRYEIRKMNVEFKYPPVFNHLDVWNESGKQIETVISQGKDIEKEILRVIELGKWK